ncbi:GNAT family N-acetyltransferase [Lacrimispora sp.]|jgi:N-acetylglutamate synthase-like GNAT family acetyltransferase|uniref:GNAT family N-acetyltransferase n=1 Tax=Lacrimispora sp. TaxID=2719234 RepID=UPI0028AAA49B|nr:GNAT family N-acetyltransferase [Lacrimispora sp.]
MKIITYDNKYKNQVISLILSIQNLESHIDLSLEEQPDLNNINESYISSGGGFWIAIDESNTVIGTIGLQRRENGCGVMKKFFVAAPFRGGKIGVSMQLFNCLLDHAIQTNLNIIILDTPSAAKRSHEFYKKMGFMEITADDLPIQYTYPDRKSHLFLKTLK